MSTSLHATALVFRGHGLFIRGESGAGKSLLALSLLDRASLTGDVARLVSDDLVQVRHEAGELWMAAVPGFEGLIELRGRGIISRPFVPEARLDLIVDIVPDLPRAPESAAFEGEVLGLIRPRAPVPQADRSHQILLVLEAVAALPPRIRA